MFLPLVDVVDDCKWLTIGIGGVTLAEELFLKKYPYCSVYGADPADTGNFSKIGNLALFGVGTENSDIQLTVLANGSYVHKSTKVITLTKFMDEFMHSRFLHYLTIDIEGLEYLILQELVNNGKFAQDNITICQIDAELHNPKFPNAPEAIKNINPVKFILEFLNPLSPYIPIFNMPYLRHPHQKITFVNIVNPRCKRDFKPEAYFEFRKMYY
uniref:Methyltransferase FkbM domain-containing protein n=1 Tax=Panagrolaimus sp. ES5 TaxID=591445 RepID=A0AC34F6Y5_9BILA